jgi:hypothetical protein
MRLTRRFPTLVVLCLTATGLWPATALCQEQTQTKAQDQSDSRAQELEAKRRDLLARVKPARRHKILDLLSTTEAEGFDQFLSVQFNRFRAGFGKISPISNFTPAIRYEIPRIGNTGLTFRTAAAVSVVGYQFYGLRFGKFRTLAPYDFLGDGFLGRPFDFDYRSQEPNQIFFYADLRYRNFPREYYYGAGPESVRENKSDYRIEEAAYDLVAGWQPARWLALEARGGYLDPHIGRGTNSKSPDTQDRFNDTTAPGLSNPPSMLHLDTALYLAWERDPNRPSGLLGLRFARYDDRGAERFDFDRYSLDARGFLPLGSRQRIIATRFYISRDAPEPGAEVPFYLMKSLGGNQTLRGYRQMRFSDKNLIYLSGEYRWEAMTAVELAVFYDTGRVASSRSDLNFDHLRHTFGGGLRFKSMRRAVVRIDIGRSDEQIFLFFTFGPSF